jgi:hypothetical protein
VRAGPISRWWPVLRPVRRRLVRDGNEPVGTMCPLYVSLTKLHEVLQRERLRSLRSWFLHCSERPLPVVQREQQRMPDVPDQLSGRSAVPHVWTWFLPQLGDYELLALLKHTRRMWNLHEYNLSFMREQYDAYYEPDLRDECLLALPSWTVLFTVEQWMHVVRPIDKQLRGMLPLELQPIVVNDRATSLHRMLWRL